MSSFNCIAENKKNPKENERNKFLFFGGTIRFMISFDLYFWYTVYNIYTGGENILDHIDICDITEKVKKKKTRFQEYDGLVCFFGRQWR